MIGERQLEGIAKAKQAGRYRGRQSTITAKQVRAILDRVSAGEKKAAIARDFAVTSRPSTT
jgi:DNA invertase Pin-like site-specific DNA recombinase